MKLCPVRDQCSACLSVPWEENGGAEQRLQVDEWSCENTNSAD